MVKLTVILFLVSYLVAVRSRYKILAFVFLMLVLMLGCLIILSIWLPIF